MSTVSSNEQNNKKNIKEYFELIRQQKFREGLKFFAPDCKTHNPFVAGNMKNIFNAMIAANKDYGPKYPEAQFSLKLLLADENFCGSLYSTCCLAN